MPAEQPLTESTYLILATLTTPKHGYAIMKEVEDLTGGTVQLGPGTLYGVLKSMVKKELIIEQSSSDPRRRMYVITDKGVEVMKRETTRLEMLVIIGKKSLGREEI